MGLFDFFLGKKRISVAKGSIVKETQVINGEEYILSKFLREDEKNKLKPLINMLKKRGQKVIYEKVAIDRCNFGYVIWTRPKGYKSKFLPK